MSVRKQVGEVVLTAEEIMKLLPMKKKYENGGFKEKESEKEVQDDSD